MNFVTTRLQMEIGMIFQSLTLKKMQGNWENLRHFFGGSRTGKHLRKMTKKGRQKFRNFPKKCRNFWWSANRVKICQVVRESEKVENRCVRLTLTLFPRHVSVHHANCFSFPII